MLRLRFSSGLILGLVLGVPAGMVIGLLVLPSRGSDPSGTTTLQVQELTRRLEASKEEKERVDQQLLQFQKLAEQMTGSFNSLEQRFKALEEEQRLVQVQKERQPPAAEAKAPVPAQPQPTPTAPQAPTPTASAPTAA